MTESAKAGPKAAGEKHTKAGPKAERRKIEEISERGDWLDPFSGKTVAAGNEVNPVNGARREGDEAVLTVAA